MPSKINVNEILDDEDPKRNSTSTRSNTSKAPKKKPEEQADEQEPEAKTHPKRPSLTLTEEQDRALKLARVDDDVDTTTRIRAMIELWQNDAQIRKKIDRLAKQRSTELVRHRPRKR